MPEPLVVIDFDPVLRFCDKNKRAVPLPGPHERTLGTV